MNTEHCNLIKGISVCNPVDIDREYLLYTVDYAVKNNYDHLQVIGPIHDYVKGNIDGMTLYRKYQQFNYEKDISYAEHCEKIINEACKKANSHGIKVYMWHHELYLPEDFKKTFPETLNNYGDIEVSHPRIKDFLENKITDFFNTYPHMDGIILTLHETSVPLLKLKNQKLSKTERVKYVTKILYDICNNLGKELIVRPFASIEDDYIAMTKAYEEISRDLMIMDKWTQFDWSLTMPSNRFFQKIKNNPLFIEADIFGEFFGKGRLPLMLKEHIKNKFDYCKSFAPTGYVARIDRDGQIPFGDVNEVNINIMSAYLNGNNPDDAITKFFKDKYFDASNEIRSLMEETEDILIKTIYINGYLFSELSFFPSLNHCKNHYYFEMMKSNSCIDSNEWYIPENWQITSLDSLLEEKLSALKKAESLLKRLQLLRGKVEKAEYEKLWIKFCNLNFVTKIWYILSLTLIDYVKFFETNSEKYIHSFEQNLKALEYTSTQGKEMLKDKFYCINGEFGLQDFIGDFIREIRESFYTEKETVEEIKSDKNILDYIVCGGGMEGHRLQKEVNFSDTMMHDDKLCRIPGNTMGEKWSSINAHGWFSYNLSVKPFEDNIIKIELGSMDNQLDIDIVLDEETQSIREAVKGRKEFIFKLKENKGQDTICIRFNKISGHVPCVYTIKSYN